MFFLPSIVPVCQMQIQTASGESVPMRCFYAFLAVKAIALLGAAESVILFLVREKQARIFGGAAIILSALVILAIPQSWVIGICGPADFPCHGTYFWTVIAGIVLIVLGAFTLWFSSRKLKRGVSDDQADS
ncbi:DUF4418 family protein [Bacillota bacterium LX-D]|nr:DUF4418 family protein [Bacillota bacterium LX-D]